MALTIDSSPLSPTCNSYVGLAEMAAYASANVADESIADLWADLTDTQKAVYLIDATRRLDGLVEWIGSKSYDSQKLRWPRINAVVEGFYLDATSFPQAVKDAACEMVIWLMSNDGVVSTKESQGAYKSVRIGPIDVDFSQQSAPAPDKYMPDIIAILLKDFGQFIQPPVPGARSVKIARLLRA